MSRVKHTCKVAGCSSYCHGNGYCKRHYLQVYRKGQVLLRTIKDKNEIVVQGNLTYISLYNKNGIEVAKTIIDTCNLGKVQSIKWCKTSQGYVIGKKTKIIYFWLHRLIMGVKNKNTYIDHINQNKLDNRMENLRLCNHSQNAINHINQTNNTSGKIGVSWNKKNT